MFCMTRGPADNESFATNEELFSLQNRTFEWVTEYGIYEHARDVIGNRDGLPIAEAGPAHKISLDAEKLRSAAPKAVAALALKGELTLTATQPYYVKGKSSFSLWRRGVDYDVHHGLASPYISTCYSLRGDTPGNLQQYIQYDQAQIVAPRTKNNELRLKQWIQEIVLENRLGVNRFTATQHQALSAIMDVCIERGPRAVVI